MSWQWRKVAWKIASCILLPKLQASGSSKVSLVWSKLGNSILHHVKSHEAQEPNFQQSKIVRHCVCKVKEKSELERCCIFSWICLQCVAITETCSNSMLAWATILQARAEVKQNRTSLSCLALREPRNRPCVACCPCAMLSGLLESCPSLAVKDRSRFSRLWRRRQEVEKLDEFGVVSFPPCSTIYHHILLFSHMFTIKILQYRILCSIWRGPDIDFVCWYLMVFVGSSMQTCKRTCQYTFFIFLWSLQRRLMCGLSLPSAFWAWVVWAHCSMPDAPKKSQPSKLVYFHEIWSICVKEAAIFCAEPSQMLTFCTSRKTSVVWHTTTLIAKGGCSSFCAKCFHSCASAYPRSWASQPATFGHWMPICWQLDRRLFASNASTSDPTSGSRLAWRFLSKMAPKTCWNIFRFSWFPLLPRSLLQDDADIILM